MPQRCNCHGSTRLHASSQHPATHILTCMLSLTHPLLCDRPIRGTSSSLAPLLQGPKGRSKCRPEPWMPHARAHRGPEKRARAAHCGDGNAARRAALATGVATKPGRAVSQGRPVRSRRRSHLKERGAAGCVEMLTCNTNTKGEATPAHIGRANRMASLAHGGDITGLADALKSRGCRLRLGAQATAAQGAVQYATPTQNVSTAV
jgi:hypothetical protein